MGNVVLKAEKLTKRFENLLVIDQWNLRVKQGESIAILGPSGCGKTTFLRILSNLERASSGNIISNYQKIGFVFQEPRLIPWKSVKDNLKFVVEDEEKTKDAIEKVKLNGFEDYFPISLSGGMKQRVNLARALAVEPDFLVFDEPFFSLDLTIKVGIMKDIFSLHQNEKFTMITVTHDVKEALYLANKVLILSKRPSRILKEFKVNLSEKERCLSSHVFTALEGDLIREILFHEE